jgi:hypothetical protein
MGIAVPRNNEIPSGHPMTSPWVEFTRWPYDEEGTWHLAVGASDGQYSATQECYCRPDDIAELARCLQAFPRSATDEVRFDAGSKDPGWAHWVSLRFFLYDRAGHAGMLVDVGNHSVEPYQQEARFTIRCEVSTLNRLGKRLAAWASERECSIREELAPA